MTDVIIPARNEAGTVDAVVCAFILHPHTGRVIVVVDPETTDDTYDLVSNISKYDARVIAIHGREPGKGQCVMEALPMVHSSRVVFCDADIVGLDTHHVNALVHRTVINDQIILVPGTDRELPPQSVDAWPWVSGERSVPTWIVNSLQLHGYVMEVQINHAVAAVGAHTIFVQAPEVISRFNMTPQRLFEMERDRQWAVSRGLFDG